MCSSITTLLLYIFVMYVSWANSGWTNALSLNFSPLGYENVQTLRATTTTLALGYVVYKGYRCLATKKKSAQKKVDWQINRAPLTFECDGFITKNNLLIPIFKGDTLEESGNSIFINGEQVTTISPSGKFMSKKIPAPTFKVINFPSAIAPVKLSNNSDMFIFEGDENFLRDVSCKIHNSTLTVTFKKKKIRKAYILDQHSLCTVFRAPFTGNKLHVIGTSHVRLDKLTTQDIELFTEQSSRLTCKKIISNSVCIKAYDKSLLSVLGGNAKKQEIIVSDRATYFAPDFISKNSYVYLKEKAKILCHADKITAIASTGSMITHKTNAQAAYQQPQITVQRIAYEPT